ncbi:hypothetical protein N656DRAFT_608150 [Canariomyces notabilis]|uniref:Uncharacterized protein n=1 Tax=Canariomyces notabilis TaxID=2074819 RepID=A0AAN6YTY3_9PEZI|nr:hypothetical protein N656DRAFT_608150 [Canariomyces arenarius]
MVRHLAARLCISPILDPTYLSCPVQPAWLWPLRSSTGEPALFCHAKIHPEDHKEGQFPPKRTLNGLASLSYGGETVGSCHRLIFARIGFCCLMPSSQHTAA